MIKRLEQLEAAATAGPWFAHNTDDSWCMNAYAVSTNSGEPDLDHEPMRPDPHVVAVTLLQQPNAVSHESTQWEENAELIAAARNALPALLAVAKAAMDRVSVADICCERDVDIVAPDAIKGFVAPLRKALAQLKESVDA